MAELLAAFVFLALLAGAATAIALMVLVAHGSRCPICLHDGGE